MPQGLMNRPKLQRQVSSSSPSQLQQHQKPLTMDMPGLGRSSSAPVRLVTEAASPFANPGASGLVASATSSTASSSNPTATSSSTDHCAFPQVQAHSHSQLRFDRGLQQICDRALSLHTRAPSSSSYSPYTLSASDHVRTHADRAAAHGSRSAQG
jgi:hypothetical protein